MTEPVTTDAVRYYGYWTPWLIAAGAVAVLMIVLLAGSLWQLVGIREALTMR